MTIARDYEALKSTPARAFAEAQNEATNAQAKAEGWTFWTVAYIPEDMDTKYANAYEWVREGALAVLSDMYKEVHGFRPRGLYSPDMTLEEIDAQIENLSQKAETDRLREERQAQEEAEALKAAMENKPLTDNPFARHFGSAVSRKRSGQVC